MAHPLTKIRQLISDLAGKLVITPAPPVVPALESEHLRDARLFAKRTDLITALCPAKGGVIAEIGVGLGDFSEFILAHCEPRLFVAFDIFKLHELPMLWGKATGELFTGRTHAHFYRARFAHRGAQVVIEEGMSHVKLRKYGARTFDLVYVDAAHDYESVRRDADEAKSKVNDRGILVFNDYIMYDHVQGAAYGVVPVVNQLVVEEGWRVIGFALQQQLFCDIALQR